MARISSYALFFFWLLRLTPCHGWTTTSQTFHARSVRQRCLGQHQPLTRLHLFFKSPAPLAASTATTKFGVPESITKDWLEGVVDFPYTFPVNAVGNKKPIFTKRPATTKKNENATLTIRLLQWRDLAAITDMCVKEYSTYVTPGGKSPSLWDKLDQVTLGLYVALSLSLKLLLDYSFSKVAPKDHAVLVASLVMVQEEEPSTAGTSPNEERLVGMVEVSRQPPIPERNPPAIPIPLGLKELYSQAFCRQPTQGWITNLLIVPEYRGRGWARALVLACEGLARCWKTSAMNLHCDTSYRTPQKLYQSLGYQPESFPSSMTMSRADYSWIPSSEVCQSSIYIIERVPLLYLCKKL